MTVAQTSLRELIKVALKEDIGRGDLTSLATLEPNPAKATITAKSDGVLSGTIPALMVFETVDSANTVKFNIRDGAHFRHGEVICEIDGFNQTILASERVALNFLGHLSGIATLTHQFAEKIRASRSQILDTRKTTPSLRALEKAAVVHGGGFNHRFGLFDMMLIKDNHIAAAGSIKSAVARAREFMNTSDFRLQFDLEAARVLIEVEIENELQLAEAIDAGVDRLLLDNQTPASLCRLVQLARRLNPAVELEASGNVSLQNIELIAASGVDYISIGSITHSAPSSDFSLKIIG
ncbi:MAG: carboxylating nicotinate-nucleotide diphosphorylase [candidate division Zixibacteria bacterium]|nr:carboxylating nicotinate-nucleotide diphosphorylase [candidate division Zixibacteria bacterium]